jgi:LuxR family transcriptional regulator, maltose regulon positive regulatory protein
VAVHERRLSSAQAHCTQAKELVGRISTSRSWLGANVVAATGALFLAEGRVVEASRELAAAERLLREDVATVAHTWVLLLMARTSARRGRLDRAAEVVDTARDALAEVQDAGTLPALADAVENEIAQARGRAQGGGLSAPPSDAELTVLRLMVEGLSVREIAARLFVSENTVRTHRRALYRKLGVHSREEATARANALELLLEPQSRRVRSP